MKKLLLQHKKNIFLRTINILHSRAKNIISRNPITEIGGPTVCLTSYGKRISTVYRTIESIGQGALKPGRIILWLAYEDYKKSSIPSLKRLQTRGLEILTCPDYGPHKKYFPYVLLDETAHPLVTADDDVFYPREWLSSLVSKSEQHLDTVICFRAHKISLTPSGIAPYKTWGYCHDTAPSPLNFATGVSGVLYPKSMIRALKMAGDGFLDCCPRSDDIWLHHIAIQSNIKIAQVTNHPIHFVESVSTRSESLNRTNVSQGGNDLFIKKTYSDDAISKLLMANKSTQPCT